MVGAPATGIVINTPGNTLSFKCTISQSLWRYDTFVISLDNRWTVNSGATSSSMDYSGKVNNFNGTNSASPHSLQCSITQKSATVSSQIAYIYGLAVDGIDTTVDDNKYVDLRITSVVAPEAALSGNPYSWTITTYRFGTYTILEQFPITTDPKVTTDVISSVTWGPTWTSAVSEQAFGLSYFMDMSITLKSKISTGGYIEITISEKLNTIGTNVWTPAAMTNNCFVISFISNSVTCTVTGTNMITLSGLPEMAASSTIKIRNLVEISTAASGTGRVTSVKSFRKSTYPVDASSSTSLGTISIATTSTPVTTFNIAFTTATGTATVDAAGGNGVNTQSVQFIIISPSWGDYVLSSDTTITIGCPFTSGIDNFGIGTPTSSSDFYYTDNNSASALAASQTSNIATNKPNIVVGSNGGRGILTATGAIFFARVNFNRTWLAYLRYSA